MALDFNKIKKLSDMIEEIADLLAGNENAPKIQLLKKEIENITCKDNIDVSQFRDFWEFTSAETLAERLLMPEAKRIGLSDERIREIVRKICLADYSEAETEYWIEVLEKETFLPVSDYIYFPYTKGLEVTATEDEITDRILADRGKNIIIPE